MKKIWLLLAMLTIYACDKTAHKVYLIKQWHLSPQHKTRDIEAAKSLPQYTNQKDIYLKVKSLVDKGLTQVIIAEGCEGEMGADFSTEFNGWTLKDLQVKVKDDDFADIMAPIAMKLKARYPKLKVICGDNEKLIEENLLAASDLRGFAQFYQRLRESKDVNPEIYKRYAQQIEKLFPDQEISNHVQFTLNKALHALERFEQLIVKRNESFFKQTTQNLDKNPVIIIGGLHVNDLRQRLHVKSIAFEIIVPHGYSNDEQNLIYALKTILQQGSDIELVFFQTPVDFKLKQFPLTKLVPWQEIMTATEKEQLTKLAKHRFDFKLLLSDFDGDGIRDFTISTNGMKVVLAAEDTDWDNDGIDNIIDESVGEVQVAKPKQALSVNNNFLSQAKKDVVIQQAEKKVKLLQEKDIPHELLILEVFNLLLKRPLTQGQQVKYLKATRPKFSYGENVFFSFIKTTQVMEYYPAKLSTYINQEYQKRFKGVPFEKYIQAYVIPLVVHSLAHEMGHSLNLTDERIEELAKKEGWTWKNKKYAGKYLALRRHPLKKMQSFKESLKFKGRNLKSWQAAYKNYASKINKILRMKDKEKQEQAIKKSAYFTKLNAKSNEQKLAFLYPHNLVSIYALKDPQEWFAESYACCIFKELYPNAKKSLRSVELEHLLGINPAAVSAPFCQQFLQSR